MWLAAENILMPVFFKLIFYSHVSNYMEQNHYWKANSRLSGQNVIAVTTRADCQTLLWIRCIQSIPSNPIVQDSFLNYLSTYIYPTLVFSRLQVPQKELCTDICMPFINVTFFTNSFMICGEEYKLWISLLHIVSALLLLPVMSKCSALHYTLHHTNLQALFTIYIFRM